MDIFEKEGFSKSECKFVRNHVLYMIFLCFLIFIPPLMYEDSFSVDAVVSLSISGMEIVFGIVNIIFYITKRPDTLFGMPFEYKDMPEFILCVSVFLSVLYVLPGFNVVIIPFIVAVLCLFCFVIFAYYARHGKFYKF